MDPKIKEGNEKLNVSIRKELKDLLKSKAKNKRDLGRLVEEAIIKTYGEQTNNAQLKEMFLAH
jgi:hypothetical protein